MTEHDEDDEPNMWIPDPNERAGAEPTSASVRALSEGWPEQPGWVPEGGLGEGWNPNTPAPLPPHPSGPQAFPSQPGPHPGQPGPYQGQPVPYQGQPGAYQGQPGPYQGQPPTPGSGSWDGTLGDGSGPQQQPYYPPTPPPLPRRDSAKMIGAGLLIVSLVVAAVLGTVLLTRGKGGTTNVNSSGTPTPTTPTATASQPTVRPTTSAPQPVPPTKPVPTATRLQTVSIAPGVATADGLAIARTLDAYFTGINAGDYPTALAQLDANQQAKNPLSQFTAATSGTLDHDVTLDSAGAAGDGTASASVTFNSTQPPDKGVNPGEACTNWSITYKLVQGGGAGGWLISDTPVANHSAC